MTLSTAASATRGAQEGESLLPPGSTRPFPPLLLTEEAKPLASSRSQKTSPLPAPAWKVSSRERRPKCPSELGLGEELTIQVKKKLEQDPSWPGLLT